MGAVTSSPGRGSHPLRWAPLPLSVERTRVPILEVNQSGPQGLPSTQLHPVDQHPGPSPLVSRSVSCLQGQSLLWPWADGASEKGPKCLPGDRGCTGTEHTEGALTCCGRSHRSVVARARAPGWSRAFSGPRPLPSQSLVRSAEDPCPGQKQRVRPTRLSDRTRRHP